MPSFINTVIVGAGPYGLSIAANLRRKGIQCRIFGRPMDTWISHMPKGMLLKSDGFASNLDDGQGSFHLAEFCREKGIPYEDTQVPVALETFSAYGLAFRDRLVPQLDERKVVSVEETSGGFRLSLEGGELVEAKRVILAVGVTHFEHIPKTLSGLPRPYVTHSASHTDPSLLRGRKVAVVGAGASALDLAALLNEAGASVELIARTEELKFHSKAIGKRTFWQRLRRPSSGLGPGWKSRFFANHPNLFHYLPQGLRLEAVRRVLGPSGGMYIKDKVVGVIPSHLGCEIENAKVNDGKVLLELSSRNGERKTIVTDQVIAATGYKVNVERLEFLSPDLRSRIKTVDGSPILSSSFESSVPGLYLVGLAAANSFGPVMRFAYGAAFAARTVSKAVAKAAIREPIGHSSAASDAAHR
jgi:thioredoxin reductase